MAFYTAFLSVPISQAGTNPWSELAIQDLKKVQGLVEENHPGPLDNQNTWFSAWFKKGYSESLALAKRSDSYQGYYYSLKHFVNGFKDGHLHYWTELSMNRSEWPGFIVAKRGELYIVHFVSDLDKFGHLPPKNSQLVSCDGKGIRSLMETNIFPFSGNPDLESHWIEQTPMLFVDFHNPFVTRPRECTFKSNTDGKPETTTLSWKPTIYSEIEPHVEKAGFGQRPVKFTQDSFDKDNHWISIPTFGPEKEDADYLAEITKGLNLLRDSKIIVFDVRGNGGGNSQWGHNIVGQLFGEDYKTYRESKRPDQSYVEWRASKGNLAYLQEVVPALKERFGARSSIFRVFESVATAMANKNESTLLKQPELVESSNDQTSPRNVKSPVSAQVYLLTDGHCGSACLDFADILLNMEGVIHIGLPTSADTVYMDIRREKLPSSIANLSFAMKVYRNRQRGNNQPYVPTFLWEGDIWDTPKLQTWISGLSRN